jgi:flagellar biosynthesis/type III secretory pathway M-ring protein FliF/YscJ
LVSTLELGGATITSILAIVAPVVALLLIVTVLTVVGRKIVRKFRARSATVQPGASLTPAG